MTSLLLQTPLCPLKYIHKGKAMLMVMQASMSPSSICLLPDDGIPVQLTKAMQDNFANVYLKGKIETCHVPGQHIVCHRDVNLYIWGEMRCLDPQSLTIKEAYAKSIGLSHPIIHFLQICVHHGLYLNKYLVISWSTEVLQGLRPPKWQWPMRSSLHPKDFLVSHSIFLTIPSHPRCIQSL